MGTLVTMEAVSNFLPKEGDRLPGSLSHIDSISSRGVESLPSRGLYENFAPPGLGMQHLMLISFFKKKRQFFESPPG